MKAGTCSGKSEAPSVDLGTIPVQYHDLAEVLYNKKNITLPPHQSYDLSIDLLPDVVPPHSHLYFLSMTEQRAMEDYINEGLLQGTIRPSLSLAAAGFFFVKKKTVVSVHVSTIGGVKNRHPLPLTNTTLDTHSGASIFTKLDLQSTYAHQGDR